MTPETMQTLILVTALAALAGVVALLLRLKPGRAEEALRLELERLRGESERQERGLREELERSRRESEAQALGLRTEVVGTMTNLGTTQQQALAGMAAKLDGFGQEMRAQFEAFRGQAEAQALQVRQEMAQGLKDAGDHMAKGLAAGLEGFRQTQEQALEGFRQAQQQRLEAVGQEMAALGQGQRERLEAVRAELEKIAATVAASLEQVRAAVEGRLKEMQASNEARLEQMRATVDEKLQTTLEARLGASFALVSKQLSQVSQSVGEMQELAKGVGDLKRVLGEVKSRGIWGEVQLGALLEQALAPEQYYRDHEIPKGSGQKVEFAIRLPGSDEGEVLLPIDAKFPLLDYERLVAASEAADKAGVDQAVKSLERFVKEKAKEIGKYVSPPMTTNFAVMFLPVEGLYAEILRRPELVHELQNNRRVMVAGPTTLYALLNSLQMGFRTLAIQKRSSEVWTLLEVVKTEFAKYGEVITKVRKKITEAGNQLDEVNKRTRVIDRKLKDVSGLPDSQAAGLLGLDQPALAPALPGFAEPPEDEED
jgi:DNA recombination protein RmuC